MFVGLALSPGLLTAHAFLPGFEGLCWSVFRSPSLVIIYLKKNWYYVIEAKGKTEKAVGTIGNSFCVTKWGWGGQWCHDRQGQGNGASVSRWHGTWLSRKMLSIKGTKGKLSSKWMFWGCSVWCGPRMTCVSGRETWLEHGPTVRAQWFFVLMENHTFRLHAGIRGQQHGLAKRLRLKPFPWSLKRFCCKKCLYILYIYWRGQMWPLRL